MRSLLGLMLTVQVQLRMRSFADPNAVPATLGLASFSSGRLPLYFLENGGKAGLKSRVR
jgi:hypothetical protein